MIEVENWGEPPQEWVDFANRSPVRENESRLRVITGQLLSFESRVMQALTERGLSVRRIRTWINTQIPREGKGYDPGYPHVHNNGDATTVIHYILPGDVPAPLDVFDGDEIIQTIYPEPGLTVYMPDGIKHGAHRNNGTTNRTCLMVMAHSRPHNTIKHVAINPFRKTD
jgi:hypothetical protein